MPEYLRNHQIRTNWIKQVRLMTRFVMIEAQTTELLTVYTVHPYFPTFPILVMGFKKNCYIYLQNHHIYPLKKVYDLYPLNDHIHL